MPLYFEPEGRDKTEGKTFIPSLSCKSHPYNLGGNILTVTYIGNLSTSKGQWRHVGNLII